MSDIHQVYFTDEAAEELGELPSDRRALVMEKVRLMKAIGWQESLRLKHVKKLHDGDGAYEIRVVGRGPAYRLICYPLGGKEGRLVVTASCSAKGDLFGRKLKREVKRSEARLQHWMDSHGELLR